MVAFIGSVGNGLPCSAGSRVQSAVVCALTVPGSARSKISIPSDAVASVQKYATAPPSTYSSLAAASPDIGRTSIFTDGWDVVFEQVRKNVLGNAYLMEEEAADVMLAFSQLKGGNSTVREFVRSVGLGDTYRSRFFAPNSPYRFVELNFKHFLGRGPTQAEVSEHVQTLVNFGYEAEINSYIDSEEYAKLFGDHVVPATVFRGTYASSEEFNRMCKTNTKGASSDKAKKGLDMIATVAADLPTDAVDVARGLPGAVTRDLFTPMSGMYFTKLEKEAAEGGNVSPVGIKIGRKVSEAAPISSYTALATYDKVNKAPLIALADVKSEENSYVSVASQTVLPDMAAAAQMLRDCEKYKNKKQADPALWQKYFPKNRVNMAPYVSINDTKNDNTRSISVTLDKVTK